MVLVNNVIREWSGTAFFVSKAAKEICFVISIGGCLCHQNFSAYACFDNSIVDMSNFSLIFDRRKIATDWPLRTPTTARKRRE